MTGPADIPSFGPARGDRSGARPDATPDQPVDGGVRNDAVREAVEAFGADPSAQTSVDVLRACLHGALLLDITGSQITMTDDGQIAAGSNISVRGGEGPDGLPAMFVFTSQDQIARMYPEAQADGIEIQSLVQDAAETLALALSQGSGWVYVDPAGPTCALAAQDLEFALRVPRNDAVRAALEPGVSRQDLLVALHTEGPLSLAIIADDLADGLGAGEVQENAEVQVRTTEAPDGQGAALVAFTSGPEVLARAPQDRVATQTAADVVALARDGGFAGLLINAGGPWAYVPAAELRAFADNGTNRA